MLDPANTRAVALAELRTARRLARTWVFCLLALIFGIGVYVQVAMSHGMTSGVSATAGMTSPRFIAETTAGGTLLFGYLAVLFLLFDVRARDVRERIAEPLDARPVTNLEFLVGRLAAATAIVFGTAAVLALAIQAFGLAAAATGLWFGEPLQAASLTWFLFAALLPDVLFFGALITLAACLVANRLLVVLAVVAAYALIVWLPTLGSEEVAQALSLEGMSPDMPSDFVAWRLTAGLVLNRVAVVAAAAGLLFAAAAAHPRKDVVPARRSMAAAAALLSVATVVLGGLGLQAAASGSDAPGWREAHVAAGDKVPVDLLAVRAEVVIDPGRSLGLDAELRFAASGGDTALFSLNPGLRVTRLRIDGRDADFSHEDGLLEVSLPANAPAGAETVLSLAAEGPLETRFGYLDSVHAELGLLREGAALLQGRRPSIFERRFVALMPTARWLPYPGANLVPAPDAAQRDLFTLDLTVGVPAGWLVAGPGRRQNVSDGGPARFRFNPPAPVAAFGLVASRFARVATTVEGTTFELLVHPRRLERLRVFEEAAEALDDRLGEILAGARSLGIAYPYRGFTMVEVPDALRTYGGGWRLDTVQALPGMMLVRESGLPTARFDYAFRDREALERHQDGAAGAKADALARHFENDLGGGNVFHAFARNAFAFQTSPAGPGAFALDYVTDLLATRLLTGRDAHMSTFGGGQQGLPTTVGLTVRTSLMRGREVASLADTVAGEQADRAPVWEAALEAPLAELDPRDDPTMALDVLALRGRAAASIVRDGLGRERTGDFLAALRRRHAGGTFTAGDFHESPEVAGLLGDWLGDTAMPGLEVSWANAYRLPDERSGRRYQVAVVVRNTEPAPGLFRLLYTTDESLAVSRRAEKPELAWRATEPTRIEAGATVETGVLASDRPRHVRLDPYLSRNRGHIPVRLRGFDPDAVVERRPLTAPRPAEWPYPELEGIVVDDLDVGFSVLDRREPDRFELPRLFDFSIIPATDSDRGLPLYRGFAVPDSWTRQPQNSAWGRYRRTVARVSAGEGKRVAVFAAELPAAGRWRLAYHMPNVVNRRGGYSPGRQGGYDIRLASGGEVRALEFDASAAEAGWNPLGEFDLGAGETRLEVSDATDGRTVLVDAIHWSPATAAE